MTIMLELAELESIVENNVALRTINKLYPAGGLHSKVYPSTYAGGIYAIEKRLIDGNKTQCVLLDSVASQANRMEEALQRAVDGQKIKLPIVEIDFSKSDLDIVGNRLTSLQAPHRIADALFRECTLNGKGFRESDEGKKILDSTPYHATPLLRTCPTALLFGMWDSAGPKGGSGNKFERMITSEIVGINAVFGVGTASRIDPLIESTSEAPVYESESEDGGWTLDENEAKKNDKGNPVKYKKGKLSSINLGNVAPSLSTHEAGIGSIDNPITGNPIKQDDIKANGATIEYAEQTCVISLAGLRKLHFPNEKDPMDESLDNVARTVLTALGLVSFTLSVENGLDLRSRCILTQEEPATWNVIGGAEKTFTIDSKNAIKLLEESVNSAVKKGLPWDTTPIKLLPNTNLIHCIKKSQSALTNSTES